MSHFVMALIVLSGLLALYCDKMVQAFVHFVSKAWGNSPKLPWYFYGEMVLCSPLTRHKECLWWLVRSLFLSLFIEQSHEIGVLLCFLKTYYVVHLHWYFQFKFRWHGFSSSVSYLRCHSPMFKLQISVTPI